MHDVTCVAGSNWSCSGAFHARLGAFYGTQGQEINIFFPTLKAVGGRHIPGGACLPGCHLPAAHAGPTPGPCGAHAGPMQFQAPPDLSLSKVGAWADRNHLLQVISRTDLQENVYLMCIKAHSTSSPPVLVPHHLYGCRRAHLVAPS